MGKKVQAGTPYGSEEQVTSALRKRDDVQAQIAELTQLREEIEDRILGTLIDGKYYQCFSINWRQVYRMWNR